MIDFEKLWRDHYGALMCWMMARTHNREAAEEIVSDAFCRAWEKQGQLRDPAKVKAWLYEISARRLAEWWRQFKHMESLDDQSRRWLELAEPGDFTDQMAIYQEWQKIVKTMTILSRAQRSSLAYALRGFSLKQIAKIMQVPPGTVGSRLYNAKRSILMEASR